MARIRTIKPEFPQSETIGALSRDARLLFIQLWTLADDEGRSRAASRMLASLLYPFDDDAKHLIDGWLDELERNECIRRYRDSGTTYLEVCNWLKHQKIDHPTKSKLPEFREASRMFESRSRGFGMTISRVAKENEETAERKRDKKVTTTNVDIDSDGNNETFRESSRILAPDLGPRTMDLGEGRVSNVDSQSMSKIHTLTNNSSKAGYAQAFEGFYKSYPKHVNRKAALRSFETAVKSGIDPSLIIAAARRYADACRSAALDKQFIKAPDVWLNKGCWADEDLPKPQFFNGFAAVLHELQEANEENEQIRAEDSSSSNLRTIDLDAIKVSKHS